MKKILFLITIAILAPLSAANACGWYLMEAPTRPASQGPLQWDYDFTAPISRWNRIGEFDLVVKCHADATRRYWDLQESINTGAYHGAELLEHQAESFGKANLQCVASDDPRLAR